MTFKKLTTVTLSELFKRVPPNQMEQFNIFQSKMSEYQSKVNKYPEKLPNIDWEYYRKNVKENFVDVVNQFQVKYEELDHNFAKRHEVLDNTEYYTEWEQLNVKVQDEVKQFIEDSLERIKVVEAELHRIKDLKYEEMTIEQFIELRPDLAKFIPGGGKELFWPHTAEEQLGNAEKFEELVEEDNKIKSK